MGPWPARRTCRFAPLRAGRAAAPPRLQRAQKPRRPAVFGGLRRAQGALRGRPVRRPGRGRGAGKKGQKTLRKLEEKQPGAPGCFFAFCPACGLRLPRRAQARAGPMPARLSGAKWCRPAGAFRTARARPFWGAARPQWARPRRPAARPA